MLVDNYIKASSIKFNISIAPCVEIARYLKSNQQQQQQLRLHEDPTQLLHQPYPLSQPQPQPLSQETQYYYQQQRRQQQQQQQQQQQREHKRPHATPRIRRPSSSLTPIYSPKTKKSTPNKTTKTPLHKSLESPSPPIKKKSKNRIIVPNEFIKCDLDIIITLINRMLISLIKLNDNNNTTNINTSTPLPPPPTRFHSKTPPAISIFSYINRLTKFNNLKSNGLITMIYYIDILSYMYPHFQLNSWTIHRFLLVATMISQKAMEDYFYTNDHYAKVGGVSLEELNCLELDFLKRIDWRTIPINNPNVQQLYYNKLVEMTGRISNMIDEGNDNDNRYKHTKFIMENEDPTDYDEEEGLEEDLEEDDDEEEEEEEEEEGFYDSDDDINSEDNIDIEIEVDDYDYEMEENNSNVPDLPNIPMYKYDSNGFSIDGSSSPHLKRRYSKD